MSLKKAQLADQRKVDIREIEVFLTYRAILFGIPRPLSKFNSLRENWMPEGRGLLVLPHDLVEFESRHGTLRRSPDITVTADLMGDVIDPEKGCYSCLKVVWMIETLPDNILGHLAEAIHDIDWASEAVDVWP